MDEKTIARFWSKVDKRGPDECWLWAGALGRRGAGSFHMLGEATRPHIASALIHGVCSREAGRLPRINRACGALACCNPRHLVPIDESTDEKRFWLLVNKSGDVPDHEPHLGACWEWIGRLANNGYGRAFFGGADASAHRVSLELVRGRLGSDEWVLHKCDNRKCVRPDHLFVGDAAANVRDMVSKNRQRSGAEKSAKLSRRDVVEIRRLFASGVDYREIGTRFGIHHGHVHQIAARRRWASL